MQIRSARPVWAFVLMALAVVSVSAWADDKSEQPRGIGIEGKVMAVRPDAQQLVLQSRDGNTMTIDVKDNCWIQLEGNRTGKLSDVKQGEMVSVIYYQEGGKNEAAMISEGTGGAGR